MKANEVEIKEILEIMKNNGEYITLSLRPPLDSTIIEKDGNRMYICEFTNKEKTFTDVTEEFYMNMVDMYDSRYSQDTDNHDDGFGSFTAVGVRIGF